MANGSSCSQLRLSASGWRKQLAGDQLKPVLRLKLYSYKWRSIIVCDWLVMPFVKPIMAGYMACRLLTLTAEIW